MKNAFHSLYYKLTEIFIIFVLPVFLILTGFIPIEKRAILLLVLAMLIVGIITKEKWGWKKIGMRVDNLQQAFIPYTVFTACSLLGIILIAKILGRHAVDNWWQLGHFQFGFLIISFVQEFAFRGFLITRLRSIFKSPAIVIAFNTVLFALIHIVFPQPLALLPLGIAGGLGFAVMYYHYPNLILVTISHAILNFFVVLFCFFSFNQSC